VIRGLLNGSDLQVMREVFDHLDEERACAVDQFADRVVATRNLWQHHSEIRDVMRGVGPLAALLMGQAEVRLVGDAAFAKPRSGSFGNRTIWHQDAPNFPFDRRGFLTFWIAVDDIEVEEGPLTFLPGSHRIGLLGAIDGSGEETPLETLLTDDDRRYLSDPVTFAQKAGDATVHDGSLLHSAVSNTARRPRRGWGVRFMPASTLYTGGVHRSFDELSLTPFKPFEHEQFPLIGVRVEEPR
jgi:ectoine hydroxylase-related dioxygenase (phytanoyl-CoA dioxygenase family)